jgi:hypothetical protein
MSAGRRQAERESPYVHFVIALRGSTDASGLTNCTQPSEYLVRNKEVPNDEADWPSLTFAVSARKKPMESKNPGRAVGCSVQWPATR